MLFTEWVTQNNLIPAIIHFKQTGNTDISSIRIFMAVQGHQQFSLKSPEQHSMPVVRRCYGFFFLIHGPSSVPLAE